jgi:hypothetical protein
MRKIPRSKFQNMQIIPFYGIYVSYKIRRTCTKCDAILAYMILFLLLIRFFFEGYSGIVLFVILTLSMSIFIGFSFGGMDSYVMRKDRIWLSRVVCSLYFYFFSLMYIGIFFIDFGSFALQLCDLSLWLACFLFMICRVIYESGHRIKEELGDEK